MYLSDISWKSLAMHAKLILFPPADTKQTVSALQQQDLKELQNSYMENQLNKNIIWYNLRYNAHKNILHYFLKLFFKCSSNIKTI